MFVLENAAPFPLCLRYRFKLTRARWVTAARVPLPRWRTERRPCRHSRSTPAVYGPAYLAAFAQFPNKRLITVRKFEHNVKYHFSMSSKLGFRVPRWNRNDTFLRAFVKSLLFFASHRASAVGNAARDSTNRGRHRGASARGQSVWAAAEGRGRRVVLTCQTPTRAHSVDFYTVAWIYSKNCFTPWIIC